MLYRFFSAETAKKTVERLQQVCDESVLYASNPTSFNDPFEFKVALDLNADETTIRSRFLKDNPKKTRTDCDEWYRTFTKHSAWSIRQETRAALLSTFGVMCFTKHVDNHLLWSHYADCHRGACIGLDDSFIDDIQGVVTHGQVVYQRESPTFRYLFDQPSEFSERAFLRKSDCWNYEHEYRVVLDRRGPIEFPRGALREIVCGCRAFPEVRHYVRDMIGKTDTALFQMIEDDTTYSLRRVPIQKGVWPMTSHF